MTVVEMWDKSLILCHCLNRPPGTLPAGVKWKCGLTESFLFSELAP